MSKVCSDSQAGSKGEEQAAARNGCPIVGFVLGLGGKRRDIVRWWP
jgi:hypothetical protein